jgi:hypothetical protein
MSELSQSRSASGERLAGHAELRATECNHGRAEELDPAEQTGRRTLRDSVACAASGAPSMSSRA